MNFGIAAEAEDVAVFDLPEVIFGLGVGESKNRRGIAVAIDVRHAVRVAIDGHPGRQPLGSRQFGGRQCTLATTGVKSANLPIRRCPIAAAGDCLSRRSRLRDVLDLAAGDWPSAAGSKRRPTAAANQRGHCDAGGAWPMRNGG